MFLTSHIKKVSKGVTIANQLLSKAEANQAQDHARAN